MSLSCVDLSPPASNASLNPPCGLFIAQRLEPLVEHFSGEDRFHPVGVPNGIHSVNDLPVRPATARFCVNL